MFVLNKNTVRLSGLTTEQLQAARKLLGVPEGAEHFPKTALTLKGLADSATQITIKGEVYLDLAGVDNALLIDLATQVDRMKNIHKATRPDIVRWRAEMFDYISN